MSEDVRDAAARLEDAVERDALPERAAEIAGRIVARPDEHEAELERVAEEEMTTEEFADAIETAPVPRMWGYPAADWDTLDRIRELRAEDGVERREAEFRALAERDYDAEHIAELARADIEVVRDWLAEE